MLAAAPSSRQAVGGVELVRHGQRHNSAPDEQVQLAMRLIDASGRIRERTGTVHERQTNPGALDEMRLIRFQSPADLRGSGVPTIEHSDRDNDQWLYLRAYHTTRRIVPANLRDRYMGTDFFYEDIVREKLGEYRYRTSGNRDLHRHPTVAWQDVRLPSALDEVQPAAHR